MKAIKSFIKKCLPEPLQNFFEGLSIRYNFTTNIFLHISFEVTSKCNARCIMCARQDVNHIDARDMNFRILSRVVDEIALLKKKKTSFNLTGLAEPLLYEKLFDSIRYIKKKLPKANVGTITNGICLNYETSKKLIESGLDSIQISLNAPSRESYNWLCGVDKYNLVVKNIKEFISIRKELNKNKPTIQINLKNTDKTRDELESARTYWKLRLSQNDSIIIQDILTFREHMPANKIDRHHQTQSRYPCAQLWSIAKIDIDGNIYPCCGKVLHPKHRTKSELFLGNIMNTALRDVYGEGRIKEIRKSHLQDNYNKLNTCQQCDAYKSTDNVWVRNKYFDFVRRQWF